MLETIERLGVRLENGSEIVRWNMQKTYLRDLAGRGIEIVPTFWREGLRRGELVPLFEELRSDEGVIKPVMSANAQGAWRLDAKRARELAPEIEAYFAGRPLMMQPFERGIVEEGEFSMIYLNGKHSHSILKTPKRGDFRVQEEHGSEIVPITPEPALLAAGDAAIAADRAEAPLCARGPRPQRRHVPRHGTRARRAVHVPAHRRRRAGPIRRRHRLTARVSRRPASSGLRTPRPPLLRTCV